MIKVIIADDHAVFREGIKEILGKTSDIILSGEAVNGQELLGKISKEEFDIVLLDINMPGRRGLDVLKEIKSLKPSLPVLMFSMYPEKRYALRALKLKASGYLTKESASAELVTAIRKIFSGKKYVSTQIADEIVTSIGEDKDKPLHEYLSEREFEVMLKISDGKKLKDIADEMMLGSTTISTYRARILDKLSLKSDAEIVRYVIENKLDE